MPYSWELDESNPTLPRKAKMFYKFVFENAGLPEEYKTGTAIQTVDYTGYGIAIDWMMHERGIYSMAPELGLGDRKDNKGMFFIEDKEFLKDLVVTNSGWIEYIQEMLFEKV